MVCSAIAPLGVVSSDLVGPVAAPGLIALISLAAGISSLLVLPGLALLLLLRGGLSGGIVLLLLGIAIVVCHRLLLLCTARLWRTMKERPRSPDVPKAPLP
jgi:hypothetical protein